MLTFNQRPVPTFIEGDYVTLKDPQHAGVVYKVDNVAKDERFPGCTDYKLRPVYGAFGAADRRGVRTERADQMVKVDVVRAGIEHMRMQDFIRNIAKHEAGGDE